MAPAVEVRKPHPAGAFPIQGDQHVLQLHALLVMPLSKFSQCWDDHLVRRELERVAPDGAVLLGERIQSRGALHRRLGLGRDPGTWAPMPGVSLHYFDHLLDVVLGQLREALRAPTPWR